MLLSNLAAIGSASDHIAELLSSWQVSPAEITSLVKGFDDPSPLQAGGIHVNGKKYFALMATDRSIYGKQGVRSRWERRDCGVMT